MSGGGSCHYCHRYFCICAAGAMPPVGISLNATMAQISKTDSERATMQARIAELEASLAAANERADVAEEWMAFSALFLGDLEMWQGESLQRRDYYRKRSRKHTADERARLLATLRADREEGDR